MTAPDVLEEVLRQARTEPDHPAVKDLERDLSYAELMTEVRSLAVGLGGRGVVEGDRVALHLPNCVDFVVAALACLSIGAVFVPLAASDPDIRLRTIMEDCIPKVVITIARSDQDDFPESLNGYVHGPLQEFLGDANGDVVDSHDRSRLAYAIYTSGTTGTPKGVLIDRSAFASAVDATARALGLDQSTRTLCVSPFHFDGSFGTLFPTLFAGGSVVIRPREALLFPRTFFNTVASEHITYTGFSPSYLRLLLASPQMSRLAESELAIVAMGGEASSVADIRALQSSAPTLQIFNRYGPTECTIAVTHLLLTPALLDGGVVPIGVPHRDTAFYLVDEQGELVDEPNRTGELYIGGEQLMVGYWGAPELTDAVLRRDVVPGALVYRTGDLAYRDDDGNYCYGGRIDNVIKRSGVRLSLLEIAESIRAIDHVSAAACLTFDYDGELGIVAFVVTDDETSVLDLQEAARLRLPESMMPNRFVIVDSLPLTRSNKLDQRALLDEASLRAY